MREDVAALKRRFPRITSHLSQSVLDEGLSRCGTGWHSIIFEALARIDAFLDDEHASRFSLRQIKEKWGDLRIYWRLLPAPGDPEVDPKPMRIDIEGEHAILSHLWPDDVRNAVEGEITAARIRATKTCEVCGAPGDAQAHGRVRITCLTHSD